MNNLHSRITVLLAHFKPEDPTFGDGPAFECVKIGDTHVATLKNDRLSYHSINEVEILGQRYPVRTPMQLIEDEMEKVK
jgi:hypothetical protein